MIHHEALPPFSRHPGNKQIGDDRMFLTPENAKMLKNRTMERLSLTLPEGDSLAKQFTEISLRTTITALQEYERMLEDQNS